MRERRNLRKPKNPGSALDGMRTAKHGVHHLRIRLPRFHQQQALLHILKQLKALGDEGLAKPCDIVAHIQAHTFSITCTSFSGLNGLTIHPVAPALLPSCFFASSASVVSIRIGVNWYSGRCRSARINSIPFMFGMFKSVITTSTLALPSRSMACLPSSASITSNPTPFNVKLTISRMVRESSTVSAVLLIFPPCSVATAMSAPKAPRQAPASPSFP